MREIKSLKYRILLQHANRVCDFSAIDGAHPSIKDAYESGARVELSCSDDGYVPVRGYIGATTGWAPAFIVLYNRRSLGGSHIIKPDETVSRTFRARRKS